MGSPVVFRHGCWRIALAAMVSWACTESPPEPDVGTAHEEAKKAGTCSPKNGIFSCGGKCVSVNTDAHHCGACGVSCDPGEACVLGICTDQAEQDKLADPGTWSFGGPNIGGRISGIVSTQSNHIRVSSPGGGVWKTDTGAAPWTWAGNKHLADFSTVHLERDRNPSNPSRIYLVTNSDIYASTDEGASWTPLTHRGGRPFPLPPGSITVADPRPFAQMLCPDGTTRVFRGPPCAGLQYSLDSGANFTHVVPFSPSSSLDNCVVGIAGDDITGRVYLSTANVPFGQTGHVWRSTPADCSWCNGTCNSWELANTGLESATAQAIAWTGVADRLSIVMRSPTSLSRHYSTTDAGTTWTAAPTDIGNCSDDDNRALLWAGGDRLFTGNFHSFTSGDLGNSWNMFILGAAFDPSCGGITQLSSEYEHVDVRAIFADATLGKVYTGDDGAMRTADYWNLTQWDWSGPSTDPSNGSGIEETGLRIWQPFVVAHATNPSRTFLGAIDNGSVCKDGGQAFEPKDVGALGGDVFSIVIHPVNQNRGYALNNVQFTRTDDLESASSCTTTTWSCPSPSSLTCSLNPGGTWNVNRMAVDPRSGQEDAVAVAMGGGNGNRDVFLSTDGGVSWNIKDTPGMIVYSVYIDDGGNLFAATESGLYHCTSVIPTPASGAATTLCATPSDWELFGTMPSPLPTYILGVRRSHPPAPYPDPTYWMATTSGLFRGSGAPLPTWTLQTGGGNYTVNEVETIPGHDNCVYAALGFVSGVTQHRGGIRFSSDNGTNWTSLTAGRGIHNSPIADIDVDRANPHRLRAAVYGRGMFLYRWGNALPVECGGP